jgi:hypothetical protein
VTTAGIRQHQVAFDQRRKGDAPLKVLGVEIREQFMFPNDFARGCLETVESARAADR